MPVYQLHKTQKLPVSIEEIWEFISSPKNLQKITPDYMGFKITTEHGSEKMFPGMIISYKVSPILNIPMTWVTEITHVKELEYFVDEQRVGPYQMWHHEHHLEKTADGVLMTDLITYQPPLGFLGAIANSLVIKKQLADIFDYRKIVLAEKFGQ